MQVQLSFAVNWLKVDGVQPTSFARLCARVRLLDDLTMNHMAGYGRNAERQHLNTEHSLRVSFVGTFSTDGFEV